MECPICKERMEIVKIEGVVVDICHKHGAWLDKGEMEIIIEASKKRGEANGFVQKIWNRADGFG